MSRLEPDDPNETVEAQFDVISINRLTNDNAVEALRFMYQTMQDELPLTDLIHLAFDTWLSRDRRSVESDDDTQALNRFKTNISLEKTDSHLIVPRTLISANLAQSTLRHYCTSVIFTRSFGAYVAQKCDNNQHVINVMFKNSFQERIDPSDILYHYYYSQMLSNHPHSSHQTFDVLIESLTTTTTRAAENFQRNIDALNRSIRNRKNQIRELNLFSILHKFEPSDDSQDDDINYF